MNTTNLEHIPPKKDNDSKAITYKSLKVNKEWSNEWNGTDKEKDKDLTQLLISEGRESDSEVAKKKKMDSKIQQIKKVKTWFQSKWRKSDTEEKLHLLYYYSNLVTGNIAMRDVGKELGVPLKIVRTGHSQFTQWAIHQFAINIKKNPQNLYSYLEITSSTFGYDWGLSAFPAIEKTEKMLVREIIKNEKIGNSLANDSAQEIKIHLNTIQNLSEKHIGPSVLPRLSVLPPMSILLSTIGALLSLFGKSGRALGVTFDVASNVIQFVDWYAEFSHKKEDIKIKVTTEKVREFFRQIYTKLFEKYHARLPILSILVIFENDKRGNPRHSKYLGEVTWNLFFSESFGSFHPYLLREKLDQLFDDLYHLYYLDEQQQKNLLKILQETRKLSYKIDKKNKKKLEEHITQMKNGNENYF